MRRTQPVEATAAASFEENAGAPPVGWLEEVVMLDVRGMHCGGCAANVRRILEAEESCVSAAVKQANESARVRVGVAAVDEQPVPEFDRTVPLERVGFEVGPRRAEQSVVAENPPVVWVARIRRMLKHGNPRHGTVVAGREGPDGVDV